MDSISSDFSSAIDTIRRADVSRRGGVRVRGGRLPPIRIRGTGFQPAATKKVIAPKIPPRRIKREEAETTYGRKCDNRQNCETTDSQQERSAPRRGRGPKMYLQSEGTFLGEGPAFKLKKEIQTTSYERGSKGSRAKMEDTKFDPEGFKHLLDGYDGDESCFEGENLLMPVRFPIIKHELKQEIKKEIKEEIKQEIKDEIQQEIKEEVIEIDNVKQIIKKEPVDDLEEECDVKEIKDVDQLKKADDSQTESGNRLDDLKFLKGENVLFYLQMPSCLPFEKPSQSTSVDMSSEAPAKINQGSEESEMTTPEVSLKDMKEGLIGKLQILRSGKIRLVMGSVKMAVESTMEVPNCCEAVRISIENEEEGNAVVIGNVDQKMVLRPLLTDVKDETRALGDTC